MPVNRSYGYSGYGGTYSSNYVPGMYTSNFTSAYGGRAGSQSPATLRATTPARNYGSGMAILQEERNGRLSPTATYSNYTVRKDYYTPSAYSRIYSSEYDKRQERRTINTDEIDMEEKKENRREHAIPGEITRDTTLNIRGGKAVVRMVTTKLKESPYVAGGWRARMAEKEEKEAAMTLGQRLALKHQIVEKPKVKQKSPPHAKDDSGEESEWTWETCSSSEAEDAGPPKKKKTPTPPKRKVSPKLIKQKPRSPSPPPARKPLTPDPPKRAPIAYTKSNTTTLCSREDEKKTARTPQPPPRNTSASRWMDRLFGEEKPKPKTPSVRIPNMGNAVSANKSMLDSRISKDQPSPSTVVRSSVTGRPLSWAGIPGAANVQDVQANIHTENRLLGTSLSPKIVVKKPASSSSTTSSSPPLYKYNPARKQQKYKGAGSQYIESSDEEQHEVAGLGRGWRPGQPPRGDVVVKLLKDGTTAPQPVIDSEHSQALAANRALTSQAAISSRVPASMGEKYQIPGLFIKPSVKTAPKSVKPVEAKLTLKPEGTVSLTTKEAGYQSSIFTPSKSPLPTVKPLAGLKTEEKEESAESEWEYYTETEPSDEEEKPVASDTVVCNGDAAVSLGASAVKASVPPLDKSPPKTLRFGAKKMPVKIEEIGGVDKKRPVLTKGEMASNKVAASAVAALRKTKPHPTTELPEPNSDLSGSGPGYSAPGSGPGYSAPMASKPVQQKPKAKPLETKPVPKFIELKPTPKAKPELSPTKASVTVSKSDVSDSSKPVSKAIILAAPSDSLLAGQPVPAPCTRTSAAPQVQLATGQDGKKAQDTPNNTALDHANLLHEVAGKVSAKSAETVTITQTAELEKKLVETDTKKASVTVPIKAPQTVTKITAEAKKAPEPVVSKKVNPEAVTRKVADTVVNGLSETAIKKSLETPNKKPVTAKPGSSAPSEAVTKKSAETVPQKHSVDTLYKKPAETTSKKPAETVPKKPANTIQKMSSETVPKNPAETIPKKPANTIQKMFSEAVPKKPAETASKNPAAISTPNPATTLTIKQTELVPKKPEGCVPKPSQPSPVLSHVKAAPNNLPSPELLRRVEFDWTKSPSPMSPPPTHKPPSPCQMTAASLERLPSQLQNMFTKTENAPKEKTADSPAWFDNAPKESGVNPLQAMNAMKADANRTQVKKSKDEDTLIKMSDTAETPWYDDEDDDMKELLKNRPTILREIDQTQDRRLTPEENMAVIKMYGGVMFPGGEVEKTPKSWLFKIRKALRGGSKEKKIQTEDGVELRAGSASSTSSSVSSITGYSKSPSLELRDCSSDSDEDEKDEIFKNPKNEAPTKYRPSFKKYGVRDFKFLRVLGKGSFGKVLLTELRGSQNYYAVKALKKDAVLEDDDIECTMIERKVLALGVKHPFLCHLFCTFQTDSHLFFVMEYLNGGDLMFHIQQQGRFDTERARFYSAEIVCALKFLHKKGIVYRDLKLDNLLLDYEGHIRIVDFGMCKLQVYLDKTADTFCGTPDYMAPEIIKGMKYTHSVDWWSFGVLLYEMLIGQSPFNGCDEDELFWSICNEQAYFPRFLSKEAKQLLVLLLDKNPGSRLGVCESVHGDVKKQPFFRSIDFTLLEAKKTTPPYKPKLKNPMDVSYFDTAFTDEPVKLTPMERSLMEELNQGQFKGFSYTNRTYTK